MPRRVVLTASLIALLAASDASAKGIEKVEVCGAQGCSNVTKDVGRTLFFDITTPGDAPPASAFVRIRFTVGDGTAEHRETFGMLTTTDGRHLRAGGPNGAPAWYDTTAGQTAALRRAIRGVEPFPASRMPATRPYEPPQARVVETFSPAGAAADTAEVDRGGGDEGPALGLLAGGALLALLAGATAVRRLRPRRGPPPYGAA